MSSDAEAPPSGQASATAASAAAAVDDVEMDIVHNEAGDSNGLLTNGIPYSSVEVPSTPMEPELVVPASQETILSTEGPGSPMDADDSFRTELNDDNDDADVVVEAESPPVIPSSLTPPPSQQQPRLQPSSSSQPQHTSNHFVLTSAASQRSSILSPPGTTLNSVAQARRDAAVSAAATAGATSSSSAPTVPSSSASITATAAAAAASFNSSEQPRFVPPTPAQIAQASPDELRALLQASLAEHTRLQTETAHHELQYNLLTMQADEDAKRAAVEHEMTRREIEALRMAESARQARRDLSSSTGTESSQAKYRQLKAWFDEAIEENETLQKRVKLAKRVIQQKEEEMASLIDEKELLLNRLRENREHFHLLCSPGGMFHGAMTPKPSSQGGLSPVQTRATPYQTPKRGTSSIGKLGRDPGLTAGSSASNTDSTPTGGEPFAALLQALNQENNSAPNTPLAGHRAPPRNVAKHVRNVQSMSSLPTTPTQRPRGEYAGLLPSVDLVPQTEPAPLRFSGASVSSGGSRSGHNYSHSLTTTSASGRYFPETPTRVRHRLPGHPQDRPHASGRRSRESTISIDEDNAEGNAAGADAGAGGNPENLARQALESVAAIAASSQPAPAASSSFTRLPSLSSHSFPSVSSRSQERSSVADEHIFESQASQAASAMLRRDARESFEIAASRDLSREASRDLSRHTTPAGTTGVGAASTTTEKSAKLQAKLFGGVSKIGNGGSAPVDKRKFSSGGSSSGGGGGPGSAHPGYGSSHGSQSDRDAGDQHLQASPTKKVRIVPSLRDNGDSYRHHHLHHHQSYQQQQQQRQQQQRQQEQDRVGLGIRYD